MEQPKLSAILSLLVVKMENLRSVRQVWLFFIENFFKRNSKSTRVHHFESWCSSFWVLMLIKVAKPSSTIKMAFCCQIIALELQFPTKPKTTIHVVVFWIYQSESCTRISINCEKCWWRWKTWSKARSNLNVIFGNCELTCNIIQISNASKVRSHLLSFYHSWNVEQKERIFCGLYIVYFRPYWRQSIEF
jgi:hypothetical protein